MTSSGVSFREGTLAAQMDGRKEREASMDMPEGMQARQQCKTDCGRLGGRGTARYEMLWRPKSSLRSGGDGEQKGEEGFKDSSELSRAWCCHILSREEPA